MFISPVPGKHTYGGGQHLGFFGVMVVLVKTLHNVIAPASFLPVITTFLPSNWVAQMLTVIFGYLVEEKPLNEFIKSALLIFTATTF